MAVVLPPDLKPGCFGVSHAGGVLGAVIRHATESWAGHAFVYVGEHTFPHGLQAPAIVEATWPRAKISLATSHADARWAVHEPLTDAQRDLIVTRALELVGDPYDVLAYLAFTAMVLHMATARDMGPLFAHDEFRVCSALVADTRQAAGIRYWPDHPVNEVSPADLDNLAEQRSWF